MSETTETKQSESDKIQIVYAGRVSLQKGKIGHKYLDDNGNSLIFDKPLIPTSIGAVIECIKTEFGVKGSYDYKGHLDRQDKRYLELDTWKAKDRATYAANQIKKDMKVEVKTKYDSSIENLKAIYKKLTPFEKNVFLLRIQQDIQKY